MILHRDDEWLVVDKPTGLATHAGAPGELGAVEWLAVHRDLPCHVVSRLDRGTSGVLLLARTADASARAQEIHESGEAEKIYRFWSATDSEAGGPGRQWRRDDDLDGKAARTDFVRLGRGAGAGTGFFQYEARIARGRRHQIRRHAAASGVPLLGDADYGGRPFARLALHCAEVRWPGLAEPVTAPDPPSFIALAGGDEHLELALCDDRRGRWLDAVTDARRAVHRGEIEGLPASLEIFGPWFQWVVYDEDERTAARVRRLADETLRRYGCRGGVVKTYSTNPHRKSLVHDLAAVGSVPPPRFTVTEHGLSYEVNLDRTQHTGLFLDQRDTRRRVALVSRDARVANLFAFTCSFSVVAAARDAEVVHSVDTAKACLRTGMANFEHNGLTAGGRGKFVQEDARRWLQRQLRRRQEGGRPFDLVVCDPPVFAGGRGGQRFSVEQEWPVLATQADELLAPDGAAVFANNHRGGDHARYRRQLEQVFPHVVELPPPLDFPRLPGEPHHVRTFWCTRGAVLPRHG